MTKFSKLGRALQQSRDRQLAYYQFNIDVEPLPKKITFKPKANEEKENGDEEDYDVF